MSTALKTNDSPKDVHSTRSISPRVFSTSASWLSPPTRAIANTPPVSR